MLSCVVVAASMLLFLLFVMLLSVASAAAGCVLLLLLLLGRRPLNVHLPLLTFPNVCAGFVAFCVVFFCIFAAD